MGRPEFLNRLHEIIHINRLGRADMNRVVDMQMRRLQVLLADGKITLAIDEQAKLRLANAGYVPIHGARPVRRVMQRELQNPFATVLLSDIGKDGDRLAVSVQVGRLTVDGNKLA